MQQYSYSLLSPLSAMSGKNVSDAFNLLGKRFIKMMSLIIPNPEQLFSWHSYLRNLMIQQQEDVDADSTSDSSILCYDVVMLHFFNSWSATLWQILYSSVFKWWKTIWSFKYILATHQEIFVFNPVVLNCWYQELYHYKELQLQ